MRQTLCGFMCHNQTLLSKEREFIMEYSPIFGLPLLHVGQAAKELTHNESIMALESLLRGRAKDILSTPPVANMSQTGDIFLIGGNASGDWVDRDGGIALNTGAGWLFLQPSDGFSLYVISQNCAATYGNAAWVLAPEIPAISASLAEDTSARARLDALCNALAAQGLIRLLNGS